MLHLKRRAQVLLRDGLHYRREAFRHGMHVLGYEDKTYISDPGPGDVLVIWNRSFQGAEDAERFSRGGARIVVAENGLLGKGWAGGNWYSLALDHIAGGGGHFNYGGPHRFANMGVELHPWKTGGGTETVILGQRGIGERGIKSPEGWAETTQAKYGGRIRPHPGRKHDPEVSLAQDLANASAVITWASSAALQALVLGVSVFYELPTWIGALAALPLSELGLLAPRRDDVSRLATFQRLAWAQWKLEEIDSGEAFRHLLGDKPK